LDGLAYHVSAEPSPLSSRKLYACHVFVGTFGTSLAGAFSPDGRWVVTAAPIAAVLWPADSPLPLFYLRGHTGHLTSVSFAPDGRRILTASKDGTVRIYDCEVCGALPALETLAEARLARMH